MGFTLETRNKILNHVLRGQTYTPPTTVYAGLLTSSGEVSASDYERRKITFSESVNGELSNDEEVRFPIATSDWGTVNGMALFDSETGGNRIDEMSVPSKKVDENEQPFIPVGGYETSLIEVE